MSIEEKGLDWFVIQHEWIGRIQEIEVRYDKAVGLSRIAIFARDPLFPDPSVYLTEEETTFFIEKLASWQQKAEE